MLTLSIILLGPLLCTLYCLYAQWKSKQPWPDFGGRVAELSSLEEWEALVDRAAAEKLIIVVDLFALWCPPCRRAAPVYAQMSDEMRGAAFVKINVDKSPELAAMLGARVMPTFKLFRSTPLSPLTNVGPAREGGLQKWQIGHMKRSSGCASSEMPRQRCSGRATGERCRGGGARGGTRPRR